MSWINAQLSSYFPKKEMKKLLGGKTLIKNFLKYKKGVSHYHFGANAHSEMIVYTFLLPCKNEKDAWWNFLAGPYIILIRSGIDFYEFRKQENLNTGASDLLNILIMSEKSKEKFENSC